MNSNLQNNSKKDYQKKINNKTACNKRKKEFNLWKLKKFKNNWNLKSNKKNNNLKKLI